MEKPRTLPELCAAIRADWKPVHAWAKPYLEAMECCQTVNDKYFAEDGKIQVIYFLSNATSWKGEVARTVKKELKKLCGIK